MVIDARHEPAVRPSPRVPGLLVALAASLAVTAASGALGAVTGGAPQLRGGLLGGLLVGGFFVFGTCATALAAAFAPALSLFVALLTYLLQVAGLALVLAAFRDSSMAEAVDVQWLAGVVIVGTLAWTVSLVAGAVREVRSSTVARTADEAPQTPDAPGPPRPGPGVR